MSLRTLITASLLGLACAAPLHAGLTAPPVTVTAAAVVNGDAISGSELNAERLRLQRRRDGNKFRAARPFRSQVDKEALENLIDRQLLYQESLRGGVEIPASAVDAEIAMLKGKYRTDAEFAMSLRQQGMNERDLARQITQNLAIEAFLASRFKISGEVGEQEARAFYDGHLNDYLQPVRIRLSHILAAFPARDGVAVRLAARRKIAAVQKRLEKGALFADLAAESDDKSSRNKKGDLGYFTPGQLGNELENTAFNLNVGQVSSIVQDRFGYHLLMVTERREQTYSGFREVREDIDRRIRAERRAARLKPLLHQLRETATIHYQNNNPVN